MIRRKKNYIYTFCVRSAIKNKKTRHVKRISQRLKQSKDSQDVYKPTSIICEDIEPIISNTEILLSILDWFKRQIDWKALVNRHFSLFIFTFA